MPSSREILSQIGASLMELDDRRVVELTREALDAGVPPAEVIEKGLTPGITEVGQRFERNEFFLPELLVAADVFTQAVEVIKPHLTKTASESKGSVVLGTVKGDIHEIGKNVVKLMLEVAGFEVHDLGIDVPVTAFIDKQRETGAEVIGASALLTSTMPVLGELTDEVKKAGLPAAVMVGGAPVREHHATRIGADGYSPDAIGAVRLAGELVERVRAQGSE
jgi:corrinoid protein of di/trimethylamine methyltransferase